MVWASAEDVLSITGASATAEDVALANATITVYSNRSYDASDSMTPRDLFWLKQAAAWQAKWLPANPGFGMNQSARSTSQDGVSTDRRAEWEENLAPMAARALKNLSWKGDRTERVPRVDVPLGLAVVSFLEEYGDNISDWETL